jgi:prephenate dehydrogenase
MFSRVAIVGLGLIGGSIGLALRRAKAAQHVAGYDLGRGVSERARYVGAIDQAYDALADTVRGADLVVLATPVGAMHSLLHAIAPALTPGTVVTDVASTKAQVMRWANDLLPSSVSFVGGHPMTGKELSGVEAADPALFQGRIYCVTPPAQARPSALARVSSFVELLGARVRFMDAVEHDELVAGVSHLPFLASIALVQTVSSDASWGEAAPLAAGGFRDMSRLAAGSPEMYRDICMTNSEAITHWLDTYILTLQQMRQQIAQHSRDLGELFTTAQETRQRWLLSQDEDGWGQER